MNTSKIATSEAENLALKAHLKLFHDKHVGGSSGFNYVGGRGTHERVSAESTGDVPLDTGDRPVCDFDNDVEIIVARQTTSSQQPLEVTPLQMDSLLRFSIRNYCQKISSAVEKRALNVSSGSFSSLPPSSSFPFC